MMGLLSGLFGQSKEEKAFQKEFHQIQRILGDEEFQLEFVHPTIREVIDSNPVYDQDPNGSGPFGFVETNPIPTNGPIGELAYLSRLETQRGERILFHRIGAISTVDVFEAVTFSGSEWFILFVDFYHLRKSTITPDGFRFMKGLGQLSGFNKYSPNFPYDFVEMKHAERNSGLSMAYIPIGNVMKQIEARSFSRPRSHEIELDLVKSKLTSRLGA